MTETQLLIGSLSNDLLRVANLSYRGSDNGARRFLIEAKRWALQLEHLALKPYIQKIVKEVNSDTEELNPEKAEKYMMYSILLQNYALHNKS